MEAGALRQVAWPARAEAGRLLGPGPSQCPRLPFLRSTRQTRALGAEILWYSTERTSAPSLAELLKPWEFTNLTC